MDGEADKQEQKGQETEVPAPSSASTQQADAAPVDDPTAGQPQSTSAAAAASGASGGDNDEDKYEREDIQKKTFAKWINSQLAKGQHAPVTDLFYDLRDGTRLLALLEVLTNKSYKREKGRMRVHHLNNVSRALAILEEHNVKLVNISNEHIVDGSAKLTLGLVWAIILHWQVQGVLKDVMSDLQQTNLEKTLLAWCRQTTKGYHGVDVTNFTTSWTDGLAFNALIHSHRPQLFDWTVTARKHPYARLENAFRVANEHFNIERLLDPEDVNSQVPDKKSIMMYVMCLFQALPHASFTMESLDISVQSDSSFSVEASSDDTPVAKKSRPLSNVSIGLGEYQRTLEEVLTWLLGAEDRLAAMPPIADTTDEVKDQFHDLEELMLELTSKQGGIGDVLGEGSRLLREGVMEEEEEEEVRVQMKLLNTRWEELRVKAMDRQSKLHEKLMSLQQQQLESLRRWLTDTEDRIANMSQVGPSLEALQEQIAAHQSLQADLEKEQSNINSLSNMVVVVDESSSDAAYSTLEDELNALGERWAHICKWAESRWITLQTLVVYWQPLSQGMTKMRQWMDEKETLLRQVESNPSTEQEHILQQASMLQVLQAEMEVQQRCFEHIQEQSSKVYNNLPQDSPVRETISADIETIQDRLECLVSIIEAQTQRLAANGIDITKIVVPGSDSSDVVSSSTTTISHEGSTVVTKIITTKVVTTEAVEIEGSGVKRQKLEGGSQEDFSVALHQLGGWIDSIEEKIKPKQVEDLSLEQLMQLIQQLETEMETQKEEYHKVVSLGQSAISETSTIGESSQESENQVAGIICRWEALMEMIVVIRTRVTYLTQKRKISSEHNELEANYQKLLHWYEDVEKVGESEPHAVSLQLEQCQKNIDVMNSQEESIKALKLSTEGLDAKWSPETQILLEQMQIFITNWEILLQRLLAWKEALAAKQVQVASVSSSPVTASPPPESLLKAIEASREWLRSLETAIASECTVTTLPEMQDVLVKLKDLSQKVETEQGNMAYINDASKNLTKEGNMEVMDSVAKLNSQWESTTRDLEIRLKNIEKMIEKQKQYNDEMIGLKSWLAEVDVFLQAEEAALGDIETLEAQLEQSNALQDDIATLQNNFNNISTTGKQLVEEGNKELKELIQTQLDELNSRWNGVTEQARVQNKSLKEALAKSQKVHEDIEKLNKWLGEVEKRIPLSLTTDKEEEVNAAIETFSQLREDISKHSEDFRALNNIGDEMLQLDASATHEELARQFTQLNGRWTEVVSQVDSKHKTLTTAAQQYEDFKKYCSEEKEWLDQLQAALEKSTKSAADAEEISEALDELEIFLHSHNEERLEQIRNLAESLVREGCMSDAVQEATQNLTERFNTLNAQATEQQSGLEGRVQEAQAWEREYISVLDYLAQSDLLLTQAIADPELQVDHSQVKTELALQQEVLKKMQKQVEVYRSQDKTEAAVRLEDQVTHLQKKYEEVEMKLRLCQKPSDFDERLDRMSLQLEGISKKVDVAPVISGDSDAIQEQLDQCMGLYQILSEIKAEVENVIATGRKIVKDGQSTDPDDLTQRLDQLKALYNQLGGAVTEHRSTLERALRHSRKVQKDGSHLEEWLTTTECELDQREATVPTKSIQAEVHFAQSEQESKEAEMEKFIVGLGEIKGWLASTEQQLANIGSLEEHDQAKLVKSVASEVQNYKSHIENIRDTAVDLINHGTLFQARVQPELVHINQRWENIFKTIQVTAACETDSSSFASISRSSALWPVVISPVSSVMPVCTEAHHYSVENSQTIQVTESKNTSGISKETVTHFASGMSSTMMDFFSRHSVLIIDNDAKEREQTVDGDSLSTAELKVLKEESNSHSISINDSNKAASPPHLPSCEIEKHVSAISVNKEAFPSENSMEPSCDILSCGRNFKAITETSTGVPEEVLSSLPAGVICKDNELDALQSQDIHLQGEVQSAATLTPTDLLAKSCSPSSILTQVVEASDIESGSTIEVIYQIGETRQRKKPATLSPADQHIETSRGNTEAMDKEIPICTLEKNSALEKVVRNVDTAVDSARSSAFEIKESVTTSQHFMDNNVAASTLVPCGNVTEKGLECVVNIKDHHEQVVPSAIMKELSGEELKDALASVSTSQPITIEQQIPESAYEIKIESLADISDGKLSVALRECDFSTKEGVSSFSTSLNEISVFSQEIVESAALTDVQTEVSNFCTSEILLKSSEEENDVNICKQRSRLTESEVVQDNTEYSHPSRRLSVANKNVEIMPIDIPEALVAEGIEAASFAGEQNVSEDVNESFSTAVLSALQPVLGLDSFKAEVKNPADSTDTCNIKTDVDNKIASADKIIETKPSGKSAVVTSESDVLDFDLKQTITEVPGETFRDAALLSYQTVLCSFQDINKNDYDTESVEKRGYYVTEESGTVRKLSTADKNFEVFPLEATEALATPCTDVPGFVWKKNVSDMAKEGLKEAVLVAPQAVLGGTLDNSQSNSANDSAVESEKNPVGIRDTVDRKLSLADRQLEVTPLEVTGTIATASIDVPAFAWEQSIPEVVKEGLKEAVLASTQVIIVEPSSHNEEVCVCEVKGNICSPQKDHIPDSEITSEVSEESIPLGGEAALLDALTVRGCEGKTISAEGSDFDMSIDDISFVQGIKSAIPSGYTYRANIAEDDTASEAMSYYDIETSVSVQDKYGVAVTVIGTLAGSDMHGEDDDEGKQLPLEEGGLESIKMESSFDTLLKSSRQSSRGASLENLLAKFDATHEESSRDVTSNKVTFLTEVNVAHSEQEGPVNSSKIDTQDEIEKPFDYIQQSRKVDINLDNLTNISIPSNKKEEFKETKGIKRVTSLGDQYVVEPKLQYLPFSPAGIRYGSVSHTHIVQNVSDHSKHQLAENVDIQDKIIKSHYVPHMESQNNEKPNKEACDDKKVARQQQSVRFEFKEENEKHAIAENKKEEIVGSKVLFKEEQKLSKDTGYSKNVLDGGKLPVSKMGDMKISYVPHVPVSSDTSLKDSEGVANVKCAPPLHYVPYVPTDKLVETEKTPSRENVKSISNTQDTVLTLSGMHTVDISPQKQLKVHEKQVDSSCAREVKKSTHEVSHPGSDSDYYLKQLPTLPRENLETSYMPCVPLREKDPPQVSGQSPTIKCEMPVNYVPCVPADDITVAEKNVIKDPSQIMSKTEESIIISSLKTHENKSGFGDCSQSLPSSRTAYTSEGNETLEYIKSEVKDVTALQHKGDILNRDKKIHYVPHVPIPENEELIIPPVVVTVQKQKEIVEKALHAGKETDITSDEEGSANDTPLKVHKTQDIKINYVPAVPITGTQEQQTKADGKPESIDNTNMATTRNLKTSSVAEAQVHVSAAKEKESYTTQKITVQEKLKDSSIQYVPCAEVGPFKSTSGARPKEIHYVPHSPADLAKFKPEEQSAKFSTPISVIVTSPSSSEFDVLTSGSSVITELSKQEAANVTKQSRAVATTETVIVSRSYVKDVSQQQTKDEVDRYLQEVTALADQITSLKNKTQVVPAYQDAQEKVEALEQELALLEPDVATVISRGDTLTLTTHMTDVPRANTIRIAVNDLRNHWSALKSDIENIKSETEVVNQEVNSASKKADDIVNWINDVSKRLHLVNNDESQLEALEKEMASKKEELDKLNASGVLLKKYKYHNIQPVLTLLNTRWTEISMQFRQYRKVSLEKKTIVAASKVETEVEPTLVPDFVASVNRLREAISAISRQLSANKLAGKPYDNLKVQEDELKVIKGGLETLKPRVDGLEEERNAAIKNVTPTQSEQVRRVMDKLREEWAQVNRGYTDRHDRWLQCSENWRTLHKTTEEFSVWLNTIEERVQTTASQPLPDSKITQKELEKQVTLKHRPSQTLQTTCKEITEGINPDEGKRIQERVDSLMKRWRSLLLDLAARREKIAVDEGGRDSSSIEYEALVTWVDQAQALMDAPVNVTDEASLSAHTTMVQNHLLELTTKQNMLKKLKESKPKAVSPAQISVLEANMNKVVKTLPDYKNMMDTKLGVIKTLVMDVEELYKWTEEMRIKTALHNLTEEEIKMMKLTLHEKEVLYENLDSTYWVLAQDAEGKGLTVAVGLKNRMNTIESRLKALQGQVYDAANVTSSTSPSTSPTFSRITPASAGGTEKVDKEKVVQEKRMDTKEAQEKSEDKLQRTEIRPVATGTTVTSSVTNVIQNVIKFEESVLSTEGELRPPSPLVRPPKHAPDSSPALILASLDKSILQIRDWLTLMEQMTRQQTVVVGDAEDIRQLTEKQKSVLRELEGKKPQLDELVASADSLKDDASRTQLHQKVSKLREHWDETNSVVLARKTQLDAMYSDTHKFDAKRAELETWLSRMEARLERMAPVAHTADVLDQQIREQKGFHAEIHQYKHQVELFNQMTQRLIAIYQHDDTRRLKKITESINLRYSSLNSSIIARGKALHSAMNSLHNFDKALDKFASWMSEAESNTDLIELEVDKLGPARRDPQARGPAIRLKDLQSEIESHKDVLASLNATGQKLLGTLENQDEAVMLQRRLEEMNQRWNTLKHKSIAIRNRLEGNAENWNTLLLSLRELIEWVIRKDTELTALGPLVGDLESLAKFSEDLSAFRRVIDEKQPVIESNLKSGRQLIASEPPLSDTSDSEAGRELDGDARYRGDDSARDLTRSVRREVAKLSEKWAALRERAAAAAAQADLAHKKLGVLQKTVEEVSGRLEEAQKTADGWGPISQDPNLADQHAHNVRKFREGLAELQRGVDDVNDQAARFSAHNVPLTPANSAKLHDLNNRWKSLETAVNDRWRQVASRSREVTPLTPAQLASSVSPPWERATTSNKVPYYINHDLESTHWDHPIMMDLLDSMNEFNHIKFSAYRTATKLRILQKKLALDLAKLQMATDIFDEHGLRGQNDRLIDVNDMVVVLSALYANISADHPEVNTTLAMDLCLNWLLNVYDSQRTGQMRVLSFKIGLVCLCFGHLEEKYRYMFRLIADPNRLVDQRKLGLLLHDCVQVPRQLGEVAAFGGSNIEPSVRSCFTKAGKDRETIEAVHFLTWVQQEPQSLVWLAVLHRVAASENVQHQVKCNICKAYPIVGLRYRCLKCLSFDMCQRCFFEGRSGKNHKITHPMHEYCTATTAGEDVKDFTKALKNKFKSKRSLQKHTKKGYLPVQTVLEGDPLESPSPSPQHNVTSQDMHSRLELYASRLAEVELRTNSNSTPDSEDEHGLIAQYCQSLSSSDAPLPVPRSPLQIMAAVDAEQKDELEQMIRALEEENSVLQAEYDRLKSQQPVGSPPDDGLVSQRSEADMLAEAKLLRQHKGRLEARMAILEEHNRQLEAQLHRLRQLLGEPGVSSPNKSGTLQTKSVTASQLAMDSPAKVNGHSNQGGATSAYEGLEQMSEYVRPPPPPMGSVAHVGNLFSRAGDLGKAVGTLVATMTHEGASDLPSDEEDTNASESEEEKAV